MEEIFSAERLILARQRRGMNKTRVARAVRVTAPTLTAWERAEREPSAEMIVRLSDALGFPPEFFFVDMGDMVPLNAASFRALSKMTASQRDAALASGTLCMELNAWIEERFELPPTDIPDLDPGLILPAPAAARVRAQWGLGSQPIANVLQTVEAHGVRVFALAAECREVDAFSFWQEETNTPFIIVGTHKTPERQVFDVAHELGHLVLHRDHAAPRGREAEREADQFASNFLMPQDDLLKWAPRSPSLADLTVAKHRWKVATAALNYRMHDLRLITDWHYQRHCIELSREGRHNEARSLPREQSQVLTKVLSALREEGVGRSDIATDLRMSVDDLDALIGLLAVSVVRGEGRSDEREKSVRPDLRIV